ncbi:hypothetical protein EGI32_17945 [Ferruginibacter sp. HRS2-29]|nr:hypothetical protein [Ferruginibacter sp. HRS2-29]
MAEVENTSLGYQLPAQKIKRNFLKNPCELLHVNFFCELRIKKSERAYYQRVNFVNFWAKKPALRVNFCHL